jgi:eukaryotic-like serine/threonine-protein kinase
VAEARAQASSYVVLGRLATGGMAELFLARAGAGSLQRHVVLKRILPEHARNAGFIAMFLDEARLAAQLQHPNVAQVFDIGRIYEHSAPPSGSAARSSEPGPGANSWFFTMEYVHGETVHSIIDRSGSRPIPLGNVLTVIAGAAAGLHHAHERIGVDGQPLGIVHRDVSPSNLMVSFEGTVKVVDFGIAKAAQRLHTTGRGTVKGKLSYMSPEQCRDRGVDRRTDLFSLGIVMWEMLVGKPLFDRDSDFNTMAAIIEDDVPPPSQLRADVPPAVDAVVMKLLARPVETRYQTADELAQAIDDVAAQTGASISTPALGRLVRDLFGARREPWFDPSVLRDARDVPVMLADHSGRDLNDTLRGYETAVDLPAAAPPSAAAASTAAGSIDALPATTATTATTTLSSLPTLVRREPMARPPALSASLEPLDLRPPAWTPKRKRMAITATVVSALAAATAIFIASSSGARQHATSVPLQTEVMPAAATAPMPTPRPVPPPPPPQDQAPASEPVAVTPAPPPPAPPTMAHPAPSMTAAHPTHGRRTPAVASPTTTPDPGARDTILDPFASEPPATPR